MKLDSRAEELLHAIAASPDDDAPRLVLADHIADRWPAHAAWIVAQCTGKATPELEQAFLAELPAVLRKRDTVFWRGFVDLERWEVKQADLLALDPDELFRLAPTCTRIEIEDPTDFAAIAARVQRFDDVSLYHAKLDTEAAGALARTEGLAHLRALALRQVSIDDAGTAAFLRDACFHALERFQLDLFTSSAPKWRTVRSIAKASFGPTLRGLHFGAGIGDYPDFVEIVPVLPALVDLGLASMPIDRRIGRIPRRLNALVVTLSRMGDDVADALASSTVLADATVFGAYANRWSDDATVRWIRSRSYGPLRELRLGFYETPAVSWALVESDLPQSLERLTLSTMLGADDVKAFADAPWLRLRELALDSIGDENVLTLVSAPWIENLERLSLRDNIDEPEAAALVAAMGPRARLKIQGGMVRSVYERLQRHFGRRLVVE